jgi:hypothetical protein
MVQLAIKTEDSETHAKITAEDFDGSQREIKTFADLQKWWQQCEGTARDHNSYNEICYDYWSRNPKWEKQLEKVYMEANKWGYEEKSVAIAKANASRNKDGLKGCVVKNITCVKVDIIHQLQKLDTKHQTKVVKKRTNGTHKDASGKYKKLKPGEYVISKVEKKKKKEKPNKSKVCLFCCCVPCI